MGVPQVRLQVAVWLLLLCFHQARALETADLANQAKPSVMLVTVYDSGGRKLASGSGFFIASGGRLVTNYHVIRGASSAIATLGDGTKIKIRGGLAVDRSKDIAILQAEGGPYTPLSLGDSNAVRAGDKVVVVGCPLGLSYTVSEGIVSALRPQGLVDEDDPKKKSIADEEDLTTDHWGIQITAAISAGSSGSPVLTPAADVIAVAVGSRDDGQAVNFGVPIQAVRDMLGHLEASAPILPLSQLNGGSPHELARNLGLSVAFFAGLWLLGYLHSRRPAPKRRVTTPRPPIFTGPPNT